MPKKVLITGHSGFTGKYMVKYLSEVPGIEVFGTDIRKSGAIEEYCADLTVFKETDAIIQKITPDFIINLIGVNYAAEPLLFYTGNVFPVINILRSVSENNLYKTKILIISSSAVYGNCKTIPINEQTTPDPINLYGSSKLAMEQVSRAIYINSKLKVLFARPFNILGAGLPEKLAIPSFIKQLIDIRNTKKTNIIKTGNLYPKRDFIDIQDVVNAYWKILIKGKPGEVYNIGSGISVKMFEILSMLIDEMSIKVIIESDQVLTRKNEIMDSCADITKIKGLGWKPEKDIHKSLSEMIQFIETNY